MHYKEYKSILSAKNGMNIYRGCTHGCIYCDSRSNCYQISHEFEDVEIKENAAGILEMQLSKRKERGMISTGSMSDPYIHLEQQLQHTRACLEVIYKYGFGVCLLTKSNRVLRDLDILKKINEQSKCVVQLTLTTYDEKLCKILEPNVSTTKERFEVLKVMRDNNIPTVVWLGPFLPYINDSVANLKGLLDYCVEANVVGIVCFGFGLTLREGNREYFYEQLDNFFPGMKEQYIKSFGNSYGIRCSNHAKLSNLFEEVCKENNILYKLDEVFNYLNTYESNVEQLTLF